MARGADSSAAPLERRGRARAGRGDGAVSSSADLEVAMRLLGTPAVRVADAWLPLRPTKACALLAYVAHRGRPVARSELAALLWPDLDPQHAATNLRQLLRALATSPFGVALERDRDTVRCTLASDSLALRQAVDEERWEHAVTWYRGPFLEGFAVNDAGSFGAWATNERRHTDACWRRACLNWLDALVREGRYATVGQVAERLLVVDPFDEVALRHVLAAAVARGDTHGARRRFEAFCEALRRDGGREAEAATLDVGERLDHVAGATGRAPREASAPFGRRASDRALAALVPRGGGRQRLIGRENVLADLIALVRRDDVRLLTLLAPAGTGKTALAVALADVETSARGGGLVVVPLADRDPDDTFAQALADAVTDAMGTTAGAFSGRPDARTLLAARRALVLLDGFDAFEAEVGAVEALVHDAPELKVIVTARQRLQLSSETVYEVPALATADVAERTRLDSEPSAAARLFLQLADRGAGRVPFGRDRLARVERICLTVGGNPRAIECLVGWLDVLPLDELERQLGASWDLLRSDDRDRCAARCDLEAAIDASWRRLGSDDRAAWTRLATMPGSLDREAAAVVAGTGWRGLRRLLDNAIVCHREDRLEMHALLRRFGRERAATRDLEAAWEVALPLWCERCGEEIDPATGRLRCMHEHDLGQALGAWRWALARERWDETAAMAPGLLRALSRAGRNRELALAVGEARAALASGTGGARDRALARVLPFAPGPASEIRANVARALALAAPSHDHRTIGDALAALVRADRASQRGERAARASNAYRRARDVAGLALLLLDLGAGDVLAGRFATGEARLRKALQRCLQLGDGLGQARAHDLCAIPALLRGDVDGARGRLKLARALYEAAGAAYQGPGTACNEAWAGTLHLPRTRAEAQVEACVAVAGAAFDPGQAALLRGHVCERWGDFAALAELSATALEQLADDDRPSIAALLAHQRRARALAALGDCDEAARQLRRAVVMTRALAAPRFVARVALAAGALALVLGRREQASRQLLRAWHHPVLEAVLRDDLRSLADQAGIDLSADASDHPPSDERALRDLEAWLEDLDVFGEPNETALTRSP